MLTVDDDEFWEDVQPLEINGLPAMQESVMVVGFPTGGDDLGHHACGAAVLRLLAERKTAVDQYLGSAAGKSQGAGPADTLTGTGDDGDLAAEVGTDLSAWRGECVGHGTVLIHAVATSAGTVRSVGSSGPAAPREYSGVTSLARSGSRQ